MIYIDLSYINYGEIEPRKLVKKQLPQVMAMFTVVTISMLL